MDKGLMEESVIKQKADRLYEEFNQALIFSFRGYDTDNCNEMLTELLKKTMFLIVVDLVEQKRRVQMNLKKAAIPI